MGSAHEGRLQALQRRAHAPRTVICKTCILLIRYLRAFNSRLRQVKPEHFLKLFCFTGAAVKAQVEDPSGLVPRGLAIVLLRDGCIDRFQNKDGNASLVGLVVREQRRVVLSTFGVGLNGSVDRIEFILSLQVIVHQIHCGIAGSPRQLVDKLEVGRLYLPLG